MFFSPDTSPSSLATSSPVESSATHVPSSPPRESRKSPPLPKLNLDDCKPIFSSTSTNTSNNAAANPSTAFVFTSSRTLRNLHNYSQTTDDAQGRQPSASSQVSSHVPASPGQQHPGTPKRPALSAAQLASHSVGAVDARCIVSLSMRAAGFVPLPRSPAHRPSGMSGPSTPMHSPVPTPADPPYFPPIVFVNPSNVTTTSLWDYQRNLQYGSKAAFRKARYTPLAERWPHIRVHWHARAWHVVFLKFVLQHAFVEV
ncbi:uncharacterized protein PHACADRAFT_158008 [Phanerochaete carnosa HHB-10118-sp]|uniref:Uncharacterized protein n=1 Tax=Phanerochaete carnosa (strain HHB-10118-sp) TaxID=650164 RepID=K5X9M6_PHACS|nr:uncharacterized protein PHACADRAFT_158008 [Phanerochaete carnosa HHB-10118-sp]EKM59607.1 hypothetical protein PHACADRAFT_158008 [Phanerochaete carnosa HHB-10118-sp]